MLRTSAIFALAFLLTSCAERNVRLPATAVVSSANATVDVTPIDDNTARVVLHVTGLPPIAQFAPGKLAYVVWALPIGEQPQNLGTLRMSDQGEGVFVGQARHRYFDLAVTAEEKIDGTAPIGEHLIRARVDE